MKTQPNDTIKPIVCDDSSTIIEYGLTKREYFAAMAMQGLLASTTARVVYCERISNDSVNIADALINALNQSQP